MAIRADLIYDVGSNNGDDAAYYLFRGFKVLAIEANPLLTARLEQRFARQLAEGQLKILAVAVAEREGILPFWVNEQKDKFSSFNRELACRNGTRCHEIQVPARPFSEIIAEFGVPYYLKIDIEGSDALCINCLDRTDLPRYISSEVSKSDDVLTRLFNVGYRRFKLINQSTYTESTPVFDRDIAVRALRKACVKLPPLRHVIRGLPSALKPRKHYFDNFAQSFGYRFPEGSSGPFGEETYGPWCTLDTALRRLSDVRQAFLRAGPSAPDCWYDVHATY
jgi:FkbM family methyltransferase